MSSLIPGNAQNPGSALARQGTPHPGPPPRTTSAVDWVRYLTQLIAWCERDTYGRWHPLPIGGQELDQLVYNPLGRALLAFPGYNVIHTPGTLRGQQLAGQRASYINSLLIQSRGSLLIRECDHCAEMSVRRPFPFCIRMPGHFGGACGNCKWPDYAHRCSVRDGQPGNATHHRTHRPALLPARTIPTSSGSGPTPSTSGSSQNPIQIGGTGETGNPIEISSSDGEEENSDDQWP